MMLSVVPPLRVLLPQNGEVDVGELVSVSPVESGLPEMDMDGLLYLPIVLLRLLGDDLGLIGQGIGVIDPVSCPLLMLTLRTL